MSDQDSEYVCSLDAASLKKAKEELFENPEDRLAAVRAFRDWIKEQPHIKYDKTDTLTLLKFLRWAKFSQLRARDILQGNLRLKVEDPKWFYRVDTHDPDIVDLLSSGFNFILPKPTAEGCTVMVHRMALINPDKYGDIVILWYKFVTIVTTYVTMLESAQVNGIIIIMDFSNFKPKALLKFLNPEMQKFQKIWQKRIPIRFKEFNYYNAGIVFDTIMTFFKPFISKKFLARIFTHDTAESLYKKFPMETLPVEYLPDDYTGPNAGTTKQLAENFKNAVTSKEFREDLLYRTGDAFSIDERLAPSDTPTEHFRKLNVE